MILEYKNQILEQLKLFEATADFNQSQSVFDQLDLSIKTIFKKEEQGFKECDFPDLWLHARVHQECVRTLASFYYEYFETNKNRTATTKTELIEFLRLWIEKHQTLDNAAGSYQRIWKLTNE
jgi:hemerythrin